MAGILFICIGLKYLFIDTESHDLRKAFLKNLT